MKVVLEKTDPLIDEPVSVRLIGAPLRQVVRLRAESVDSRGIAFRSWADYEAGVDGTIVAARHSPRAGTYRGGDAFGLWWSMASDPEQRFARDLRPVPTTIAAEVGHEQVARVDFERMRIAPGVSVEKVRDGGLVATLFLPVTHLPAPGVMVLGGSEGGIGMAEELAALLASHGFASMALAYFGAGGLPPLLAEVPIEYLEDAMQRLLRRPEVSGRGLGVVGISRGGELALLLASTCSHVRAVVGFAASSIVWPGFTPGAPRPRSAWTHRGRALPFATPRPQPPTNGNGRLELLNWFLGALQDEPTLATAAIPVERIRGAVLLVSGRDDRMWPSRWLADRVMQRLAAVSSVRCSSHVHLSYPGAGHGVGHPPGLPEAPACFVTKDGTCLALGGSRSGNARSAQRAWPRVISFLSWHLGATQSMRAARTEAP
jgi:dienelactone hydrolase